MSEGKLALDIWEIFWNFAQSILVAWHLKMEPIGCPKTSVTNNHSKPRKTPEQSGFHFHSCASQKSRNLPSLGYNNVFIIKNGIKCTSVLISKAVGQPCPVSWPNLIHGRVMNVSQGEFHHFSTDGSITEPLTVYPPQMSLTWNRTVFSTVSDKSSDCATATLISPKLWRRPLVILRVE
jgi:hypothetical protein